MSNTEAKTTAKKETWYLVRYGNYDDGYEVYVTDITKVNEYKEVRMTLIGHMEGDETNKISSYADMYARSNDYRDNTGHWLRKLYVYKFMSCDPVKFELTFRDSYYPHLKVISIIPKWLNGEFDGLWGKEEGPPNNSQKTKGLIAAGHYNDAFQEYKEKKREREEAKKAKEQKANEKYRQQQQEQWAKNAAYERAHPEIFAESSYDAQKRIDRKWELIRLEEKGDDLW